MGRPRLRRSVSPSVTTSNTWTRSWSKSATKTWPSPATTPDSWQNGKLLPVKTCSSLPLRLSSCTRLPTNSATTIEPLAMIAQASGSSKGTAVRNTRRKAPSYVFKMRGLDTVARPRAAARQPPSRGCVRGADKARAPVVQHAASRSPRRRRGGCCPCLPSHTHGTPSPTERASEGGHMV